MRAPREPADRQPSIPDDARAERARHLEALVTQYGRLVAHAVRTVAGRSAANDQADIEQEVMLALWRRLAAEQPIAHPASYLYTAAIREAVRVMARVHRRAEQPLEDVPAEAVKVEAEGERHVEQRQRADRLRAALDRLPPDRARAVRGYLAGLDVAEMMELYEWSYQRARNLVARGIADLKAAMRESEPL